MLALEEIIGAEVFGTFLLFCRIGGAIMLMPGVGDTYVSPTIRLSLALLITALLAPVLINQIPVAPDQVGDMALLIGSEVAIGVFLGLLARLLMAALDTAGMMISFQIGLANALVFNPSAAAQGSLISSYLTIVAVTLIFVTDLHHVMLLAIVDSYTVFPAGNPPAIGDMADTVARLLSDSFSVAFRLAAPFFVFVVIFFLMIGLLNKLMPAVQIFFIALPVQIVVGALLLGLLLSAMMLLWLDYFESTLMQLLGN